MAELAIGEGHCFHCAEALPAQPVRVEVDGEPRAFCCDGCSAAAVWIREARLTDYYQLRREAADRVGNAAGDHEAAPRQRLAAHAKRMCRVGEPGGVPGLFAKRRDETGRGSRQSLVVAR